jgi:hypothetical protein
LTLGVLLVAEELVQRVQDRESAVMFADGSLGNESSAARDTGHLPSAEKYEREATGLVDQCALEGRDTDTGLDPDTANPPGHLDVAAPRRLGDRDDV